MNSNRQTPPVGARLNRSHPLAKGLVGCWLMNEGNGDVVYDVSGNGNNGTLTNMDPETDWVSGAFGRALDFDGINDYVKMSAGALKVTKNITISAWVRAANSNDKDSIIAWDSGSVDAYGMYLKDSGSVDAACFFIKTLDNGSVKVCKNFVAGTIVDGQWYHMVGVYDGMNARVYLDAIEQASGTASGNLAYSEFGNQSLNIGADQVRFREALIADVCIFNRALTSQEIKQLYITPYAMFERPSYVQFFDVAPAVGAIMSQMQCSNLGADLYNGTLI